MKYFYIEPDKAGGLGLNTEFNRSARPPTIAKLHFVIEGWLGDSLLETSPCFVVTEAAQQKLEAVKTTGASFDEVEVTKSEGFEELYPNFRLPKFVWLRPDGKPGQDDIAVAPDGRLVISQRVLEILQSLRVSHAVVREFE